MLISTTGPVSVACCSGSEKCAGTARNQESKVDLTGGAHQLHQFSVTGLLMGCTRLKTKALKTGWNVLTKKFIGVDSVSFFDSF
jgi:hypothetical protein